MTDERITRLPMCDFCDKDLPTKEIEEGKLLADEVIVQPHIALWIVAFCNKLHSNKYWKDRNLYMLKGYNYKSDCWL